MNESKTQCATCGVTILQRTADAHYGLCAPCYRRSVAHPPANFELPHDLVQHIVSSNEAPDDYRAMAWRLGVDSVHHFLDQLGRAAAECRRRSPDLRAFAADCRRLVPSPPVEDLSGPELGRYRLLRTKMSEFIPSDESRIVFSGRPDRVAIVSTTRVGLPAAQAVFARADAVILETSEQRRWLAEIRKADATARWWFALAWWTIEDRLHAVEVEAARIRLNGPEPADSVDWLVRSGVHWCPLHGGVDTELWRWNGERAEFIATIGRLSF